jgi:hypothetical protein
MWAYNSGPSSEAVASPTSTSPMPAECSSMATPWLLVPAEPSRGAGRDLPAQDQVDWTRLDTRGSTQLDPADRGFRASDLGKNPVHTQPRPGGAAAVVWAVEKQQQCVTPPI